jgi:MoxR-like ATPase
MSDTADRLIETVTLKQAKGLIRALAAEQSLLLLSPPGVGKSDIVRQAAGDAGLPCRSLLGTQIAPEDVSGIPRIVGERSVFCPPRVLLPEEAKPFCLFLDELPACAPDVQKAFYSLLLERRLGEHLLPPGTWVVAAGNRAEDRALVRTISSALLNRVTILQIEVNLDEWIAWAEANRVRRDVIAFVKQNPDALLRPVPRDPVPFSTPRAWASLARALDLAEQAGILSEPIAKALAHGRVSAQDAAAFVAAAFGYQTQSPARPAVTIDDLDLSVRLTNVLAAEGIDTIEQLLAYPVAQLLEIRNFGPNQLGELREKLQLHGLTLTGDDE